MLLLLRGGIFKRNRIFYGYEVLYRLIFIFLTGLLSGLWKEIMEYKIKKKDEEINNNIDEGIVVIKTDISFSTTFMTKDRKYIVAKGYPLKDDDGKLEGAIAIVSDITKENIDFLNRTKNLASKGKMALYIAHEIRNPLNVIKGLTQLIELKNEESEYTELILENVQRIDDIIEIVINIKEDIRYKNAKIRIGIDEKTYLYVDKENLRKILVNLITNGIEAAEENPIIYIYTLEEEGCIHLNVKDNGPGIPDVWDKIFEPFFTTKKKGTG